MTAKEVFISKMEKGLDFLFNKKGVDSMYLVDAMNGLNEIKRTELGGEIIKAYEEFRKVDLGVALFWYIDRFRKNVKLVNNFEIVKEGRRVVLKRK
jgi:hypothetical protein